MRFGALRGHFLGLVLVAAVAVAAAAQARAQTPNAGTNRIRYTGTLGSARIGLALLVKDRTTVVGGHYFYATYLTDIPLAGSSRSGTLTLTGRDGGAFALAFVGNGSEGGKPLDFDNSVGLEGTWSRDGKTLPVKLTMGSQSPLPASGRWYEMVTDESDAIFEGRVRSFRKAALGGFREAAAYNVSFPLRVNRNGRHWMIRNAGELAAQWETIFTPAYLAALKLDTPHDMSVVQGQAMLGQGDAFFGPKGATALNIP